MQALFFSFAGFSAAAAPVHAPSAGARPHRIAGLSCRGGNDIRPERLGKPLNGFLGHIRRPAQRFLGVSAIDDRTAIVLQAA